MRRPLNDRKFGALCRPAVHCQQYARGALLRMMPRVGPAAQRFHMRSKPRLFVGLDERRGQRDELRSNDQKPAETLQPGSLAAEGERGAHGRREAYTAIFQSATAPRPHRQPS